jgi:hypothetical protein
VKCKICGRQRSRIYPSPKAAYAACCDGKDPKDKQIAELTSALEQASEYISDACAARALRHAGMGDLVPPAADVMERIWKALGRDTGEEYEKQGRRVATPAQMDRTVREIRRRYRCL